MSGLINANARSAMKLMNATNLRGSAVAAFAESVSTGAAAVTDPACVSDVDEVSVFRKTVIRSQWSRVSGQWSGVSSQTWRKPVESEAKRSRPDRSQRSALCIPYRGFMSHRAPSTRERHSARCRMYRTRSPRCPAFFRKDRIDFRAKTRNSTTPRYERSPPRFSLVRQCGDCLIRQRGDRESMDV